MGFWESLGEGITGFFGGIGRGIERSITRVFGASNTKHIKRLAPKVKAIGELENTFVKMTDDELRQQTELFRQRLKQGETIDDILVEAFAVCREAGRRFLAMRHYDVQLVGGMVLHSGCISEMITGEGKTLVATLPAYLNALESKGVHVVTVNDYLARRDMEWMGPLYMGLGLTVGAIYSDMDPELRIKAYGSDITYGTNNEFGFDYLRDNMKAGIRGDDRFPPWRQQVQRGLNYAIIDEVDNILIDEARTPLIISGPAHDDVAKYAKADRVARALKKDIHFEIKEKEHSCHLTEEGVREAERVAGVESFFTAGNMEWPHLMDNALKAHHLYKKDVRYVVEDGEIIIVDEFTGRKMPGRQWSDGLHQAVEAKEGVKVKEETQTLATVTLQNFFRLYKKIAGMTGTAMTEALEFWKIYKLDVIAIPPNRQLQRVNSPDVIYLSEEEKYDAIAQEVERMNKWDVLVHKKSETLGQIVSEDNGQVVIIPQGSKTKRTIEKSEILDIERAGRPILIGTVSIEKSEKLSHLLNQRGIEHDVLNAKQHKREAEIVAQAGRRGMVTIATNMAGRGTDIILGGNPENLAWAQLQQKYASRLDVPRAEWDALVSEIEQREQMKAEGQTIKEMGGLHIIGTERHEARRIDNQLRGRAGRQGDPGSSRFYLSLEDDLMRIFAGDWVKKVLTMMGMKKGEAIESKMVSRRIEGAQKKVEERHFESRKHLLEYDEVMDEQRKRVYGYRQRILEGANCKQIIVDMIDEQIEKFVAEFLDRDYGPATFAKYAGSELSVEDLNAAEFRELDFVAAEQFAKDEAERNVETIIQEELDQNLPPEEDPEEWNWEAVARTFNSRWKLSLRDRDLKKVGRDELPEFLISECTRAIRAVDLSEGKRFLDPHYGVKSACAWAKYKFGFDLNWEDFKEAEPAEFKEAIREKSSEEYQRREIQYPVMAGLYRFTSGTDGQRLDRDGLVNWAKRRFSSDFNEDDLRNKQRDEIRDVILHLSRKNQEQADAAVAEAERRVEKLFGGHSSGRTTAAKAASKPDLEAFCAWLTEEFGGRLTAEQIADMDREKLENRVIGVVEDRFRPEIRRMERQLLLELLDTAWKDHLLAMDYLLSSVRLRGYAQIDPKVEYKKVGMRQFEEMWVSIGQQTTDLVFRMEQLNEDFVSSTWSQATARHDEAQSGIAAQQQAAMDGMQDADRKIDPIRNTAPRVGRNDPCPCGSGKKYKNCCAKKNVMAKA